MTLARLELPSMYGNMPVTQAVTLPCKHWVANYTEQSTSSVSIPFFNFSLLPRHFHASHHTRPIIVVHNTTDCCTTR